MVHSRKVRDVAFVLHRYFGLVVGLILIIVGLTGSLLVFENELSPFLVQRQFGKVTPQGQMVSVASVIETLKTTYASQPDLKLSGINTLPAPDLPYRAFLQSPDEKRLEVFVNPYTGAIMGERQWENTLIGITYKLHYQLLAGKIGEIVVGIAALLLFILSITGIILWPGWRRLISGFKIKWQAHPKRTNFDIHKVSGIVTAVFLTMIAFTGFCWNFWEFSKPLIHTATLTPIPKELVSQPLSGKSPLGISELLQKADAALSNAATTYIRLPQTPEGVFRVGKKLPQDTAEYGQSQVNLDQYTGEVVQLKDARNLSRADKVIYSFSWMHYGTFWGLPSRILYVFVGLAPLILFITGTIMWWYRYKGKKYTQQPTEIAEPLGRS